MFKKSILKSFSFFVFSITFVIIILCCFVDFKHAIQVIGFAVVFGLINTYMIVCVFKNEFFAEKEYVEHQLKKKVEHSSNYLSAILNNMPMMAYVIDTENRFLTGNVEALKFFEIREGGQLSELTEDIFEGDTMEQMKAENAFVLKTKKPLVTDRHVKLTNGRQNWFRILKVPILNNYDDVNAFVVFGKNIDVERDAKRQRETYISTLSHDLKIPTLAQIRALELLISGNLGNVNDEQKEILNLTLDSCYCMYDMLSTILTTYKYENNDIILNYEKVHMLKLLDEAFSKSIKGMHNKNINVRLKAKDKFVSLYADKAQMKKAFENIIDFCVSSAYKDTEIICEIGKINNSNSVFISLGFESPYVSSETIQNMFKMYTTSSEKMDKVGSSLNLYLAKQIINAHNGTIAVESKKSNYNNYKIELPCINECKFSAIAC